MDFQYTFETSGALVLCVAISMKHTLYIFEGQLIADQRARILFLNLKCCSKQMNNMVIAALLDFPLVNHYCVMRGGQVYGNHASDNQVSLALAHANLQPRQGLIQRSNLIILNNVLALLMYDAMHFIQSNMLVHATNVQSSNGDIVGQ